MNQKRRVIEVCLFVAAWMALGWWFRLDSVAYVLLGVPLSLFFQLVVRRAPLRSCWVRNSEGFRLDGLGAGIAVLLAIGPLLSMLPQWHQLGWTSRVTWILGALGAIPAAFALRRWDRATTRCLLLCLATAGVIGCGWMVYQAVAHHKPLQAAIVRVGFALQQFLMLFPVCFVFEEVSFRGVLDAHVYRPGDARPWLSALVLAELWGLWHLPLFPPGEWLRSIPLVSVVHVSIGVWFSLCWRRSGNLAVPCVVHALVDAVRNALMR
jgi:hypothetical protein